MNLKQRLYGFATIAGIGLVSTGFILGVAKDASYERTRREVQLAIDLDRNRVITQEEWEPVYQFLERDSSKGRGYGLDISKKDLRKYLENIRDD